MRRWLTGFLLIFALASLSVAAQAENPFISGGSSEQVSSAAPPEASALSKIVEWQQQLNRKISALIRQARSEGSLKPLAAVIAIAFGYGALHAAGPGHGKVIAMSYVLSRRTSIGGGVLFGVLIAFVHGLSGALLVLGLHYILQKSVSGTLASVTRVTQTVSFSLITLMGLAIVSKNCFRLFSNRKPAKDVCHKPMKGHIMGMIPWAASVGLVPCPGVVMVMLYCLSMGLLPFGLLLAAFISLGMAVTMSIVIIAVILGRRIPERSLSGKRLESIDKLMGIASGVIIILFGALLLMTSLA